MPKPLVVEIDGGKKLYLKHKDMNSLALELLDCVPLSVLKEWIQKSEYFTSEYKTAILAKDEEEIKMLVSPALGFYPQVRLYTPYIKEEN